MGTQIFSIGHATGPWRYRVNKGSNAGTNGWHHDSNFWAFTSKQPGNEAYLVGHATNPWRYRLSKGEFAGDNGWTHDFTFWAYPRAH